MERRLNGHEVAFLLGISEDSEDRSVFRECKGVNDGGYEVDRVVVKHPDGKLYEFDFEYNTEHGIYPCLENPDSLTEAYEVEAVPVTVTRYKRK